MTVLRLTRHTFVVYYRDDPSATVTVSDVDQCLLMYSERSGLAYRSPSIEVLMLSGLLRLVRDLQDIDPARLR